MYKVFLADDEIVVREGIRTGFPWEQTDFVLAGEAPDGEIALSMLQDIKPDILITDIRMPFMDGLTLCRQVVRTMPWIHIIILSGYDDFSYAREAISLGVQEYLLKPVSGQELLIVLERIANRIREEQTQQASLEEYRRRLASSERILQQKLLEDLYAGRDLDSILKTADDVNLPLRSPHALVMLFRPETETLSEDPNFSVQSILERLAAGSHGQAHLLIVPDGYSLLILGDNEEELEERAYGLAESARFDVQRITGVHLLVAIGPDVKDLTQIPRSLKEARRLLESMRQSASHGDARTIVGTLDAPVASENAGTDTFQTPLDEILRNAEEKDVPEIISRSVHGAGGEAGRSVMMANYLFVEVLFAACRIIRENNGNPAEIIPAALSLQGPEALTLTLDEILPVCRETLVLALRFRDSHSTTRYSTVIRKACAFMESNYSNSGLTLHDVANHVALSNNHFCTVFSQETGVTFTEYLTSLRIQKAKALLDAGELRTSEIAYAVGYNDPHYFSYLFKKNTGMSPRDYRKDS